MPTAWPSRFVAIKLLEKDPCIRQTVAPYIQPEDREAVDSVLRDLERAWQQPPEFVMSSVHHGMAFDLFEAVARVETPRRRDVQHRIDDLLMHPVLGYLFLGLVLTVTISAVFETGSAIEPHFLGAFQGVGAWLAGHLGRQNLLFALVAFFLSVKAAIFIYLFNLLVVGLTGRFLSALLPEVSPGLIMEIPRYHLPALGPLARKTWFRLKEFVVIVLPILMVGSVLLELINHFDLAGPINRGLAPFTTGLLGFPELVGTTLLFGVMRKELALILLFAALGTNDVLSAMTEVQVFTYAFFVSFYVPCLATYAALGKELGWKSATVVSLGTLLVVTTLTVLGRFAAPVLLG